MTTTDRHPAINLIRTRTGKVSAVCEFCARHTRPVTPSGWEGARLSLWDIPAGWSEAPYPVDFVHDDGSTGSQWTCPDCRKRLNAGESLYSRLEARR